MVRSDDLGKTSDARLLDVISFFPFLSLQPRQENVTCFLLPPCCSRCRERTWWGGEDVEGGSEVNREEIGKIDGRERIDYTEE